MNIIKKAAPNEIDIDDLSIDLEDDSLQEDEDSIKIDDIPTDNNEKSDNDESYSDESPINDQSFKGSDNSKSDFLKIDNIQEDKNQKDKEQVEKALDQAKHLATKVDITELNININKLKKENNFLYKELAELKKVVNEFLLFRIPKYEEFDIPESKLNPELIFTFVTSALDKRLIKLFNDLPIYNAKKLSILEKDNNNNIVNAIISVEVSFDKHSRFSFLRFDLELIILDGFLNVPGWFMYDNKFYTLNEEGIRKIDLLNQRMDQDFNPEKSKSWYDANHNQKNPIYPNGVSMTNTDYLPNQNIRSIRRNF
jgi:hypothetical protein